MKIPTVKRQGFFLVDNRFEISNLALKKYMRGIFRFCEVLSIGLKDEGSGSVT